MKGAYVVSPDAGLVDSVVQAAAAHPGWAGCEVGWSEGDQVMLRDVTTGGLFLMYVSSIAFDGDGVPVVPLPGVELPADRPLTTYLVECRWEAQFVRTVREVAGIARGGAWVVDGSGVAWDAADVDPTRVML